MCLPIYFNDTIFLGKKKLNMDLLIRLQTVKIFSKIFKSYLISILICGSDRDQICQIVDLVVLQLWIPEVRNFTHFGDFQHIYFKYKTFLMIGNVLAEVSSIFFGGWPHMLGFLKISIMLRTELFTFLQTMKF